MQKKTSVYIEEFLNFLRNAQSEFSFSQEHQKERRISRRTSYTVSSWGNLVIMTVQKWLLI